MRYFSKIPGFFTSLLHVIVPKFRDIVVHGSYTVRRYFEKNYSCWAASNHHVRVGVRRPIRLQEILNHHVRVGVRRQIRLQEILYLPGNLYQYQILPKRARK